MTQKIKEFPDAFSCVQDWVSYSDTAFVDQMKEYGAGELITFLEEILEKSHALVRPNIAVPPLPVIAPKLSKMISIIFDTVKPPGQGSFIPHWVWIWLVKVQSKSDRSVN